LAVVPWYFCDEVQLTERFGLKKHWLNARRLQVYPWIFITIFLVISVVWLCISRDGLDPSGKPLGYDFITFWAASWMALNGEAAGAYDLAQIHAVERMAVDGSSVFAWFYPPTYLLLILPLALLPYWAAWLAFMTTTLLPFWLLMRHILSKSGGAILVVAFPGLWINLLHGQNAALTTALVGAALLLLKQQPWIAGVFVALLSFKPHMVVMFPLVFLLTRSWRAAVSSMLSVLLLVLASTYLFGWSTWVGWQGGLQIARELNENGALPWAKMPTVFAALRMQGAPITLAYFGQLVSALVAIYLMVRIWRRTNEIALRGSAFVLATLLISPHFFDYDLLWLALPIAWLGARGLIFGWLRGERELLVVAWLLPMIGPVLAGVLGLQLMPLVSLALLFLVWSKVKSSLLEPIAT
jgi:hypothetical protein